jgi:hypothetical protein
MLLERYKLLFRWKLTTLTHNEVKWKDNKKNEVIEKYVMERYYSVTLKKRMLPKINSSS